MIIKFKSAIQREADRFFKELSNEDFNIRTVTKSAFTKARAKLNPWAFKRLNEVAVNTFYDKAPYRTWHNRRVLATDGTRLTLPNHPSILAEFGSHKFGPKADSESTLALVSSLYDVLNFIALDAEIDSYDGDERDLLLKHLDKVKEGDLLLLDRGYPCFWLLFLLKAKKIDFCVRLKSQWWLKVKDFFESDEKERIVKFKLPKKDFKKLAEYPDIQQTEITCRLVKVVLNTGEVEILCTSLLDTQEFKQEEFKGLYHFRWSHEEGYKLLKSRIEVERFSGKTALAVKQDLYAKFFLLTLTAAYAHPIEEKVVKEFKADENRIYSQKINRTNSIATTQDIIIGVLLKKLVVKGLKAFDDIVFKTREIIRPQRSNDRKHRAKKRYYMNYKPL
jgi:Transposase DDE domain